VLVSVNLKDASSNAVDLLEEEDLQPRQLFTQLHAAPGPSVHERADYRDLDKGTIRHLGTREAAVVEVTRVVSDEPRLERVAARLEDAVPQPRALTDRTEKMPSGERGINLNQGQDFDAELQGVMQVVGAETAWGLDEALPTIRGSIAGTDREADSRAPTARPGTPRPTWPQRALLDRAGPRPLHGSSRSTTTCGTTPAPAARADPSRGQAHPRP
jgi:hypothetical protein